MSKRKDESDDDLWERVARSAKPLAAGRVVSRPARPKKEPPAAAVKTEKPAPRLVPKAAPKPPPAARGEVLSRQTARALTRGRLAVEARLDLHGMRQREAHAALKRFLKSAQGKGHRHVLVITGRGAEPDARRSFYVDGERGVLRSSVPHWLEQPDLAPLVVSYAEAPRRLGGEGALYVRLRAAQRGGRRA
ncbi:MAG TPA: Smr/MutS family protein [Methyloceanibacter sp.]|nr:Smr/MutS family protein [Methyloceanibacter sp.]